MKLKSTVQVITYYWFYIFYNQLNMTYILKMRMVAIEIHFTPCTLIMPGTSCVYWRIKRTEKVFNNKSLKLNNFSNFVLKFKQLLACNNVQNKLLIIFYYVFENLMTSLS